MKDIKFRDLRPEEIEVRVGNTLKDKEGKVYAFNLMLYKTARTDANILDETFGIFGWKNNYYQVKNTMVCSISIWDEEKNQWVNKDNGGDDDSTMEQVKSELSDSMKRAGFNLGIGRKLYTASKIYMVVNITETNTTKAYYQVKDIEYDDTSITKLVVINKKTKEEVITYGARKSAPQQQSEEDFSAENEPIRKEEREWLTEYVNTLTVDEYNAFFNWLEKNFKTRKIAELTAAQGIAVVNAFKRKKGSRQ